MGLLWSTQRANSTDGSTLQAVVANESFPTFYGDLTFDANGQNSAGALLLQYDGTGEEVQTVYPLEAASMSLVYPAPSWGWRDCTKGGNCSFPSGQCSADGECDCRGAFVANYEDGQYACDAPEDITYGCDAGEYYTATDTDTDSFTCTSCEAGSYQPDSNSLATQCIPCELGYFSPEARAANCGACANGQVALKPGSLECEACPDGAVCKDSSSLILKRGMWRPKDRPYSIYECPVSEACLGGSGYDPALCAIGYGGVLCAVCSEGYVATTDRCANCDSLNTPIATIISLVTAVVVGLAVWYMARFNKRFAAMMESMTFSVPLKIYFSTCQILGVYATLLSDVLFQPLKGFLEKLSVVTDFTDFFGGFGVSCAHRELQTFKIRLLISTILPIALSLCIAAALILRVLSSHPNRVRALQRAHAAFALLLLYVTLPSTSTMIFNTFVRDRRPLGTNGEQYLIADYAGE